MGVLNSLKAILSHSNSSWLSPTVTIGRSKKKVFTPFTISPTVTRPSKEAPNNLVSKSVMFDDRISHLEVGLGNLSSANEREHREMQREVQELVEAMNARFDQPMAHRQVEQGENSVVQLGAKPQSFGSRSVLPKLTKLEFPRYQGGDDPTSWICRVEQFFEFQQIEPEERVSLAAYHLEGDAQLWYQLLKEEGEVITWALLKEGLHARFGPTEFEDFFGDLTKLWQSSTMREYQTQFKKLLARAVKLTTTQQVGCFTSGLKEAIRVEVQAARSTTLSTTVGVARLYQAKLASQTKRSFTPGEDRRTTPVPINGNRPLAPTIRKFSPVEIEERSLQRQVASGEKLCSRGKCLGVDLLMQGILVAVDFYLLSLKGYEVVLGAQWLQTLGPIIWDFSKLQMTFTLNGKQRRLQGLSPPAHRIVGDVSFQKNSRKGREGIILQLHAIEGVHSPPACGRQRSPSSAGNT
ncbi:hypothetical protein F0562_009695 [Nyssa sinensis]|uniref:Ty3 transposon capsid-like protein domain-containing protein n=1 Tax=Nyssa sinensis TaxID=561372 RepID=A0A5J5A0M0_9ASTE|nr:hypothetical protein F0562_009695 [Nyssa sinensis]